MYFNLIVFCFFWDGFFIEVECKDCFMSVDEIFCFWVFVIVLYSEGLLVLISEICVWFNFVFDLYVILVLINDGVM